MEEGCLEGGGVSIEEKCLPRGGVYWGRCTRRSSKYLLRGGGCLGGVCLGEVSA